MSVMINNNSAGSNKSSASSVASIDEFDDTNHTTTNQPLLSQDQQVQITMPNNVSSPTTLNNANNAGTDNAASNAHQQAILNYDGPVAQDQKGQTSWIFSLVKQEALLLIVSLIGLVISTAINLGIPAYASKMLFVMSTVVEAGEEQLRKLVLFLFSLIAITAVATFVRNFCIRIAAERIVSRIRKQLFNNLVIQEIGFFDVNKSGELLNRLFADTKTLESAVTVNVEATLRHGFELLGCLCVLVYTSIKLLLVMSLVLPFVGIALRFLSKHAQKLGKQMQDGLAKASATAHETLTNMRTVRSLGIEDTQMDLYGKAIDLTFQIGRKMALFSSLFMSCMLMMGSISLVIVVWYGGMLVIRKEMDVSALVSFMIYTLLMAYATSNLSSNYFEAFKSIGSSATIYQLQKRKPKVKNNELGCTQLENLRGHIHFTDVEFSYPLRPNSPILQNFNLEIKPGEVVAFCGESGGGKSTIINLLLRFYDPVQGSVSIDGIDVKNLDMKFLRANIGVVNQEPCLFATTVAKNIAYAKPGATMDEIQEAARNANAHDFITRFSDGYNTMCGEHGMALSVGQKQRIAIARAFISDPKILLLDEATSALDAESEFLVQQALDKLMKQRTVIIIAHRLSTVKNATKVCVIKQGHIVEMGPHRELIKKKDGMYRNLVEKQLLHSNDSKAELE